MVSHAGLNSVKESIYFGVPMILFPLIRDQPSNAARAVYHGLAVKGAYANCSIERIRELLESIGRNPSIRTRTETMAQTFRKHEDAEVGTRTIVELVPAARVS
jgi:UDP:flavonoid glycosyltransferase YjiC (YdhE family)